MSKFQEYAQLAAKYEELLDAVIKLLEDWNAGRNLSEAMQGLSAAIPDAEHC